MQVFYFFIFSKQRLCIFSQKLSNENKERLYKIQKHPTSLFYHVLLIKQNECICSRQRVVRKSSSSHQSSCQAIKLWCDQSVNIRIADRNLHIDMHCTCMFPAWIWIYRQVKNRWNVRMLFLLINIISKKNQLKPTGPNMSLPKIC